MLSIDEMIKDLPKLMRIADDMHDMTSYINDLRIITMVLVGTGYLAGIGFMIFKYCVYRHKKENATLDASYYYSETSKDPLTHVRVDPRAYNDPRYLAREQNRSLMANYDVEPKSGYRNGGTPMASSVRYHGNTVDRAGTPVQTGYSAA